MSNPVLHEAARLTGLARELMERWKYEDTQASLHGRSNNNETSRLFAKKHRAFATVLEQEARELTDRAEKIYMEARA